MIDGKAVRVSLEQDAIRRLLGPDLSDEEVLHLSLQKKLETIRIAIEAYLLAYGIPMDRYFVLAWRDLSGT